MKNILVPTDFSACASHATYAAMELAAAYRGTLHLYSVVDSPKGWSEMTDGERSKHPEVIQSIHNTKVLLQEWEQIAKKKNAPIVTGWIHGDLVDQIKTYVLSHQIDFLVMGSHGASGKKDYLIGSNTQKVVRSVHIPVLIIKEKVKDYRIKKVVFASNFDTSEKKAFQYLLDFVKPFKPEIYLTQINTTSWFGQPYTLVKAAMEDFKAMCSADQPCKTYFYKDWSIDAGVRHLSEELDADMIAISNQQRHPLKRIFTGSNVEALVNHAQIPVLSIDLKDVK